MASTRSKNTPGDYCIEQRENRNKIDYKLYEHSQYGTPTLTAFPAAGSAPPSHMSRTAFAKNSIDIENALFGIGSTNLVNPQAPVYPQLQELPTIKFFERNKVIMPEPLVVKKGERGFPIAG